jgi:hypothetical protein
MRYKDDLCGLDLNIDHRLRKTEIQYSSSTVFLGEITQEECHHQYFEWYGLAVSSEEGGTSFCSLVRILPATFLSNTGGGEDTRLACTSPHEQLSPFR